LTYLKRIPPSLLSTLAHIRDNHALIGPSVPQPDPVTPSNPISRPICPRIDSDDDDKADDEDENLFAPDNLRPYPTATAPLPQPSFNFQQPQPFILKPAIFTNIQARPTTQPTTTTAMSHVHQGTGAMPGPNSSKAPLFNGETSELLEFFEVFEDLTSTYGLTSADKCKSLVRYVDRQTKHFWIMLTGFESCKYGTFKKNILSQYPGASKGQRYTVRELEHIVINQADSDINTEKELMHYYSQFRAVAIWLISNGKISGRDCDKYFWQGLPVRACRQILQRLKLKDPDFNQNEPAHFKKVIEAGRHVFSDEAFDTEFNDPITLCIQSIRDCRAPTNYYQPLSSARESSI